MIQTKPWVLLLLKFLCLLHQGAWAVPSWHSLVFDKAKCTQWTAPWVEGSADPPRLGLDPEGAKGRRWVNRTYSPTDLFTPFPSLARQTMPFSPTKYWQWWTWVCLPTWYIEPLYIMMWVMVKFWPTWSFACEDFFVDMHAIKKVF